MSSLPPSRSNKRKSEEISTEDKELQEALILSLAQKDKVTELPQADAATASLSASAPSYYDSDGNDCRKPAAKAKKTDQPPQESDDGLSMADMSAITKAIEETKEWSALEAGFPLEEHYAEIKEIVSSKVWRVMKWVYDPNTFDKLTTKTLEEMAKKYPEHLKVDIDGSLDSQATQQENGDKWCRIYQKSCLKALNEHRSQLVVPAFQGLVWDILEGKCTKKGYDGQQVTVLPTPEDFERCLERKLDPANDEDVKLFFVYCTLFLRIVVGKKVLKEDLMADFVLSDIPAFVDNGRPPHIVDGDGVHHLARLVNPSAEAALVAIYANYHERWIQQHYWKLANPGQNLPRFELGDDGKTVEVFPTKWSPSINISAQDRWASPYGGWTQEGIDYYIRMIETNKNARTTNTSIQLERIVRNKIYMIRNGGPVMQPEPAAPPPSFPHLDDEF